MPATPALDTAEAIRSVYAGSLFTGTYIFAMILGITGMTGEYRYQTITPTFLVTPRRARVVGAKMVAHLLVGAGYAIVGLLVALVAGGITIAIRGEDLGYGADRLWSSVGLAVLAVGLWTLFGIGVGTLIRNQIAAILIAVAVTFLIEPLATFLLAAVDLDWVVKWLPTNASAALTSPRRRVPGLPRLVGGRPGAARLRRAVRRPRHAALAAPRRHLRRELGGERGEELRRPGLELERGQLVGAGRRRGSRSPPVRRASPHGARTGSPTSP